jgi:hypothetical protein
VRPLWRVVQTLRDHAATILCTILFAAFGFIVFPPDEHSLPADGAAISRSTPAPPHTRLESVNIEEIRAGDKVLARDPATGEIAQREVKRVFAAFLANRSVLARRPTDHPADVQQQRSSQPNSAVLVNTSRMQRSCIYRHPDLLG